MVFVATASSRVIPPVTRAVAAACRFGWRAIYSQSIRSRRVLTGDESGFTLVEVIVALAMLSLGLGVLLGSISTALNRTASARKMAEAGSLAQSLLGEVGSEFAVRPDQRDGVSSGYRWHMKMLPFDGSRQSTSGPVRLYRISVEVAWSEGTQERSYTLTTMRLGPAGVRS
jgi:general secretion pathway protein I